MSWLFQQNLWWDLRLQREHSQITESKLAHFKKLITNGLILASKSSKTGIFLGKKVVERASKVYLVYLKP